MITCMYKREWMRWNVTGTTNEHTTKSRYTLRLLVDHLLAGRFLNTCTMASLFEYMHYDLLIGKQNVHFVARWFETCRPPVH